MPVLQIYQIEKKAKVKNEGRKNQDRFFLLTIWGASA
jgi:hypothetical protein